MPVSKNILIICYGFPPFPGVGGRRWAKFAKCFIKVGHKVNVIAAKNPYSKISEWQEDIKACELTYLPLKYPSSLILFPQTFLGRIRYKLDLEWMKLKSKGNYYDRTVLWEKQLIEAATEIVQKKNISTVVVSGAPFSLFSHVAQLRVKFPSLHLIADVRDPWTTNRTAYAFETLSAKRLQHEITMERTVFNQYDCVTTVSDSITNYFKELYISTKDKFITVPNGYDSSETVVDANTNIVLNKSRLNFVFTGSYYDQAIYLFDLLITAVKKNIQLNPKNEFHFHFFGSGMKPLQAKVKLEKLEAYFTFGQLDTIAKVNSVIAQADYCTLFLTDDINYSLSTKFCEYIKFKKPIVVFAKDGYTGTFVEKNKLGYFVQNEHMFSQLQDIICQPNKFIFPNDFDIEQFSVERLALEYAKLLK